MKAIIFFSFFLIFLSRVLFLSISPAFFDSPEYIRLIENQNLLESLKQVHSPLHPLFLTLFWFFNRIPWTGTLFKAEFLNSLLGLASFLVIFKIAREFIDSKRALLFTLFSAFTPYFWLSQISLLYEPLLCFFLLLAFYFLVIFSKNDKLIYLCVSAFSFALAFLVSSASLVYLVFFLGYLINQRNNQLVKFTLVFSLNLVMALAGYLWILSFRGIPLHSLGNVLSSGNSIMSKIQVEGLLFFCRAVRNSLVVFSNYLTIPLGLTLAVLGIKEFFKTKKKSLMMGWLFSFLLLNSFWHAGMFGRLALLLTIPPLYLLIKIRNRAILAILFLFLAIHSARIVVPYHFQKTPTTLEREYFESWDKNEAPRADARGIFSAFGGAKSVEAPLSAAKADNRPLLIISNYEEPFLRDRFNYLALNSPDTNLEKVENEINQSLQQNQTVLFTSQAVNAPYFQYDGLQYHLLSKRKNHPATPGQALFSKYEAEVVKEWKNFDLKVYRFVKLTN